MPKTIFKYPVPIEDQPNVKMPQGAQILWAGQQGDSICVWALVDTEATPVYRQLSLRGTGHPADGLEHIPFIGTIPYGQFVFHLWDGVPE